MSEGGTSHARPDGEQPELMEVSLSDLSTEELLGTIKFPFVTLGLDWCFTFVNEAAEALLQVSAGDLVGRSLWETFGEALGTTFERSCRAAMLERRSVTFTEFYAPLDTWFEVQAVPHRAGASVLFQGIAAPKAQERRFSELAATQDLLRSVATAIAAGEPPESVCRLVCERTRALFEAHSCWALRFTAPGSLVVGAAAPVEGELLLVGDEVAIVAGGQLAFVRDTGQPTSGAPAGRQAAWGLTKAATVPVKLFGELWGALCIGWTDASVDAAQTLPLLGQLAELVSLGLANAEVRATIERQAATDGLTGLGNLRACQRRLDEGVSRAARHGHPLTLALIDVDHFKAVNDGFGHLAGDQILQRVAAALDSARRDEDFAARIGGDEFALVLDGARAAAAHAVAERLRAQIAGIREPNTPQVTVSIGLCEWSPGLTREDVQRRADDALYSAKLQGRNAARLYDSDATKHEPAGRRTAELRRAPATADRIDLPMRSSAGNGFWRSILDVLPTHIAVIDEHGDVIAANRAWLRFTEEHARGPRTRPAVGQNYLDALRSTGDASDARIAHELRELLTGALETLELEYVDPGPGATRPSVVRAHRLHADRPQQVVIYHEPAIADSHASSSNTRFSRPSPLATDTTATPE